MSRLTLSHTIVAIVMGILGLEARTIFDLYMASPDSVLIILTAILCTTAWLVSGLISDHNRHMQWATLRKSQTLRRHEACPPL